MCSAHAGKWGSIGDKMRAGPDWGQSEYRSEGVMRTYGTSNMQINHCAGN